MGELLCGNLIMKTVDGKEIQFENAIINQISAEPNTIERFDPDKSFRETEIVSYNHELSITVGNITKKRFIKLLMARGIARNGAKDIALYIHKKYGCYNQMHLLLI